MKDLFQRLKGGGGRSSAELAAPRLTLAAFGKHPGWDDHIPGIGVETETLAQVKQALYVRGIGGQIDSGAWEKLDAEKRLPGYDHTFLWLRPGHLVMGQFWSSTDGKGRAKYPMALCVDGEGVSLGFMLGSLLPGLERLHEACKGATSAEQVTKDCETAQDQLRAMLGSGDPRLAETPLPNEAKRRFLERPELGPERVGFLRALHELGTGPNVRSHHLRLPLASDSRTEALSLWSAFLRCAVPDAVPLLLISRGGLDWLDVVVGEPATDDLFCFQASKKAMPLATEVPYELSSDSKQRMQDLEARFLGVEPPPAAVAPPPSPKAQAPPSPAPYPSPGAATTPAKRTWPLFLVGGVFLAGLAAAVWFSGGWRRPLNTVPLTTVASKQPAQPALTNANHRAKELEQNYQTAMKEGQTAFDGKDYTTATAKADVALGFRPNDPAATRLKSEAQTQIVLAATAKGREQKYETAMREGQAAFDRKDCTNAVSRAEVALGVRKGDPAATKLKSDAQEQINLALTAREQQQKYETAMKEGQAAFDRKDYTNTVLRAEVALGIKKGDPAATKLKSDAQEQINLAQQKEDLKQARAHFDQGDYAASLKLCDSRRGVAAFDSLAESNRTEQTAFNDANARFTTGDYSFIEQLKIQSYRGKQPFGDLLLKVVQENGILEELKALQRATNRSAVKARLAAVAFQNKPPFAALAAWAETPPTPGDIAPKQSLEKLDSDFEVMLVWFNILNPAKAQSSEAQKKSPIPGRIGPEEGDSYAAMAQDLESRFKQGGWLTPPREKNLKKLKDAIRYHP